MSLRQMLQTAIDKIWGAEEKPMPNMAQFHTWNMDPRLQPDRPLRRIKRRSMIRLRSFYIATKVLDQTTGVHSWHIHKCNTRRDQNLSIKMGEGNIRLLTRSEWLDQFLKEHGTYPGYRQARALEDNLFNRDSQEIPSGH